ncbi:uncharacterized protein LOC111303517 [Durio zibethinus]|uniref:Uncharacterized protein LOC111303517 n=1 Tax=Durio zibethinus TaxID=66656 RepID=A0A6P5ZT12_DURZI|nr:uncharacterized protein LOC111303517 [Durio zibethinus]
MKQQQQSSTSLDLVQLATAAIVLLFLAGQLPSSCALVPSGAEKSPIDVLLCGSSWRKMFLDKEGCSRRASVVVYSNRRILMKSGAILPSPPSPTRNQLKRQGVPLPPPPPPPLL